jgi:hypothetical protein
MAAYASALAGEKAEAEPNNKSLDWLCDRYYKSATFLALEDYTKRRKRTVLNEICDITFGEGKAARRLGTLPFEGMSKANVRKLRDMRADAPEAANFRLKQISWRLSDAGPCRTSPQPPGPAFESPRGRNPWEAGHPEHAQRYEDFADASSGLAVTTGAWGSGRWSAEGSLSPLTATGNSAKLCW